MFFDYAGYQKLRAIDSAAELERFFHSLDYYGTWEFDSESEIADQLAKQLTERTIEGIHRDPMFWTSFVGMLYFPAWILSRIFRR